MTNANADLVFAPKANDIRSVQMRFSEAMDALGDFEDKPHLAIAVSGGVDSMALCSLAVDWVMPRGGRVSALTVDHRLRPNSGDEATWVGQQMARLGVAHHILTWEDPKPTGGIQAAAREARYAMMRRWCYDAGVLHLLAGHQAEDQAETHLMRKTRSPDSEKAGQLGLSGVSACVEFSHVRLLRPLLTVTRAGLTGVINAAGIAWIEDPSNENTCFERVRHRQRLLQEENLTHEVLDEARNSASKRVRIERSVHRHLVTCLSLHPDGFARLNLEQFQAAEAEIKPHIVARAIMAIGGLSYPPAMAGLIRIADQFSTGMPSLGLTLGNCRLLRETENSILICRENRNLPDPIEIHRFSRIQGRYRLIAGWDARFNLTLPIDVPKNAILCPLGNDGWRQISKQRRCSCPIPLVAATTMPAVFVGESLVWSSATGAQQSELRDATCQFRPKNTLSFAGFCIA